MTTTVTETIKWAIERKVRAVNLSTGTDVSKTRWGPSVVTTCTGILLASSRRAQLKWTAVKELGSLIRRRAPALAWALRLVRRRG